MADATPAWAQNGAGEKAPDWANAPAPQRKTGFPDVAAARGRPSGLGSFAYGLGTGLAGLPGDIENLATNTVPKALGMDTSGDRIRNPLIEGSQTLFPTTEEVRTLGEKAGLKRPGEDMSGYVTAGELAPAALSAPGLLRRGVKAIAGETSKIGEASARLAEKMGFKLSAPQVARETPSMQRGAAGFDRANQKLANQSAAKLTGKDADFVDEKFLKERFKDLGRQFDNVYRGKTFTIDQPAITAVQQILANEAAAMGPSGVSAVASSAKDILASGNHVPGELIQRLRNALSAKASGSGGQAAHEIYNLIDEIDASVARNHPAEAATLDALRPKYRAAVVLEDLTRSGGINRGDVSLHKLGNLLAGTSIRRKTIQDLDVLGQVGRDNKIIGMWEKPGSHTTEAEEKGGALLDAVGIGGVKRALSYPSRTRTVRAVQRAYGGKDLKGSVAIPAAIGAREASKDEDQ